MSELDTIAYQNFFTLDSVAKGLKKQNQLRPEQTAFLYLINDWSSSTAKFDHYQGIKFNAQHVAHYKKWYEDNKAKMDLVGVERALEIQIRFFVEGLVPENDMEYLEQQSRKYRKL